MCFSMACEFLIFTNLIDSFFIEGSKQKAGWNGEEGNLEKQHLNFSLFNSHSMLCLLISQWHSDAGKCWREAEARIQQQDVTTNQMPIKKHNYFPLSHARGAVTQDTPFQECEQVPIEKVTLVTLMAFVHSLPDPLLHWM